MSREEKRHHTTTKGESKAHSLAHKYDAKKMTTVVNHQHFERNNGYESTKHHEKKAES
jgi:hypothetical protein